jgi:hypothetical protein
MNKKFRASILICLVVIPSFFSKAVELPTHQVIKTSSHNTVMMNSSNTSTEDNGNEDTENRRLFNRRKIIRRIEEFFHLNEKWGSLHRRKLSNNITQ